MNGSWYGSLGRSVAVTAFPNARHLHLTSIVPSYRIHHTIISHYNRAFCAICILRAIQIACHQSEFYYSILSLSSVRMRANGTPKFVFRATRARGIFVENELNAQRHAMPSAIMRRWTITSRLFNSPERNERYGAAEHFPVHHAWWSVWNWNGCYVSSHKHLIGTQINWKRNLFFTVVFHSEIIFSLESDKIRIAS